jgi:hypothetical protein
MSSELDYEDYEQDLSEFLCHSSEEEEVIEEVDPSDDVTETDVNEDEEYQSDYESEDDSDDESEEEEIIRAKWCMDGAKTLDEAIEKLNEMIAYLQELKTEGWELVDEILDDYGFLRKKIDSH